MSELHLTFDCKEDPRKMTPCADGLFCNACQEPVLDLTTWRREDIIRYLEQHPRTCGQLLPEQLDPTLIPLKEVIAPFRKGSFAALAALGLSTGMQAQTTLEPETTEQLPQTGGPQVRAPRQVSDLQGHVVEQRDGAWVCPVVEGPVKKDDHRRRGKHIYLTSRFPFVLVRRTMRGKVRTRAMRIF